MDKYLQECLTSDMEYKGYVLPFFWQHGEDHATLKAEMDAIKSSGATEFCVESRTHEQFCEEQWWDDFKFMLDYAKDNDMKVWLLDDKKFPTGYANGYISKHPELGRTCLDMVYRDVTGPTYKTQFYPVPLDAAFEERYVSITAWKRDADFHTVVGEPVDLLGKINANGMIEWDVPEGTWRIYYVIATKNTRGVKEDYIDMLSEESCKALIHAVYEPHYERFAEYFGNTFKGFFSDEPSFANAKRSYQHKLGTEDLLLPWKDTLLELIAKEIGCDAETIRLMLPALWDTLPNIAPAVRAGYMDQITRLYTKNFTQMIGNWCKERNVLYIGHIIEDNNAHQRLGYGPGHFFRALKGQHMSGLDIVLNQMIPGNTDVIHTAPVAGKLIDPTFFHYALAKLGSSCSHINPEMENRTMAEVFGAFGWAEGVGYMKYLADHMLVSGVNHFVPHAYTPKYPDLDCPPHFHAHGFNPQEEAFGKLTGYMQRISRMTADSVHKADVAVLYNAEAEWTGGKLELFQETCKRLATNQIDYDILPEDVLEDAVVKDGRLYINKESYGALIVSYSQMLPTRMLKSLDRLQKLGLSVIFEEAPCEKTADQIPAESIMEKQLVVSSKELVSYIREHGWYHILPETYCAGLRSYRVDRKENSVYLLFNESKKDIDTRLILDGMEDAIWYDGWNNKAYRPDVKENGIRIKLGFGQAAVLVTNQKEVYPSYPYDVTAQKELEDCWNISYCEAGSEEYKELTGVHTLVPFNTPALEPDFCGFIRYEKEFEAEGTETILDLGHVGEIADVYLNDIACGTMVAAPYTFDIAKAVQKGNNKLVVKVVNSPAYREKKRDPYATYHPMTASGLLGPVKIG